MNKYIYRKKYCHAWKRYQ